MDSCPKCKSIFPISHSFCPKCGNDLRKQKTMIPEQEKGRFSGDFSFRNEPEENSLFSIKGTIGRSKYLFHFGIYLFLIIVSNSIIEGSMDESIILFVFLIQILFFVYFLFQGKRRCNDMGKSGWFQIIPFYTLFMLFQPGDYSLSNKYRKK